MRIISGRHKGRHLLAPKNLPVRPTTDLAKESLFNILNNYYYFNELKVLDLFSGTGNIAYEFASRGTNNITCIDSSYQCIRYIKSIAKQFEFPIKPIKSDVFLFLEKMSNILKVNIVFADPPYDTFQEYFYKLPKIIFQNKTLLDGGTLIIEHSSKTDLSKTENYIESKRYGSSMFSFFKNN